MCICPVLHNARVLKESSVQNFFQLSTMSSSDAESTSSDLTSVKSSVVRSPVIQDLDIIMETDATVGSVGSGDDEKTHLKTDAEGNSTQMTDSSSASASSASASTAASTADRAKKKRLQMRCTRRSTRKEKPRQQMGCTRRRPRKERPHKKQRHQTHQPRQHP